MERSSLGNLHVFFGRCVSIHTYCSVNGGWSSQRCRWRRPTTGCVFSPLIEEHVGGFGLQKRAKSALVKDDDKSFLARNRLIALPQQFPRPLELHWSHRNGTNGHRLCSWRKRCLHREEITIENQIGNWKGEMEEIKLTMASSHSSVVVGNGHEVVDGFCVVLVTDVGAHVETSDRELDMCVQFVSPVPVVAKPLQTYHQNGGKHPKIKLFRCLLIFLTIWTVPAVNHFQIE